MGAVVQSTYSWQGAVAATPLQVRLAGLAGGSSTALPPGWSASSFCTRWLLRTLCPGPGGTFCLLHTYYWENERSGLQQVHGHAAPEVLEQVPAGASAWAAFAAQGDVEQLSLLWGISLGPTCSVACCMTMLCVARAVTRQEVGPWAQGRALQVMAPCSRRLLTCLLSAAQVVGSAHGHQSGPSSQQAPLNKAPVAQAPQVPGSPPSHHCPQVQQCVDVLFGRGGHRH